ncbi:MAG: hypothetical protein M3025_02030 [Actinomycetota bacterium]|nr:hypothetical protein [Actinomycetota bacterium]
MDRVNRILSRQLMRASGVAGALATAGLALGAVSPAVAGASPASSCVFPSSKYKHVIYVQFDNTHLRRDNPNVPSDLQQIPALREFLANDGSLLSNDHTVLISHTAGGITSTLTGLYPDRMGINVSNSYQYFTGSPTSTNFSSAFKYWTDSVGAPDMLPNMITTGGVNTPAPWVSFTRAGCDVGAVATANIELENTSTNASGDITSVFGKGVPGLSSPQAAIALNDSPEATADFQGVALHCSLASSAADGLCSSAHGGVTDSLPAEPGGYTGFNGMFGALYANQVIANPRHFDPATTDRLSPTFNGQPVPSRAPTVYDVYHYNASPGLHNPPSQPITDGDGHPGFMGFDPSAAQTLGYVAQMQEAGVPVTMAYIADAHDDHSGCYGGNAMGPGMACYEQQLHQYNQAFRAFFDRLNQDGINRSNTLFVFTVDEGDFYAGGPPLNPGCNGVTIPCQYTPGTAGQHTIGEQDVDLVNALKQEKHNTTEFDVHADSAPTVYVHGSTSTSGPSPNDPRVRGLERDMAGLTLTNARTGGVNKVTQHIADQADERILHMVNADPSRTPSFTLFGNPTYYYQQEGPFGYTCPTSDGPPGCPSVNNADAWNHGDDNQVIGNTWVGYVGPTIRNLGQTGSVWTDHTDVRPTMLSVLGLSPDYAPDGRVVAQVIDPGTLPAGVRASLPLYVGLTGIYKQLDAPFAEFARASERISTTAVQTASSGDSVYQAWDAQLRGCGETRDRVAAAIRALLDRVEFGGATLDGTSAMKLIDQGQELVAQIKTLAGESAPPSSPACHT